MKRHTSQTDKQREGVYYTSHAASLLTGYEHVVRGEYVTEPFAGGGDITRWCYESGAHFVMEYDKNANRSPVIQNDSIMNPVLLNNVVVTNPPYLARNKCKDKTAFDFWETNDLYKCHLAAIARSAMDMMSPTVEKGVLILPSNFLSERSSFARDLFFSYYRMNHVKYYYTQEFDDATTGICVFDFELWEPQQEMTCQVDVYYEEDVFTQQMTFHEDDGWLCGREFFKTIRRAPHYKVKILREGDTPDSNIVIGLLDKGKYPLGAHYNDGPPIYCAEKAFTTYQCVLGRELTEQQQHLAVVRFNDILYQMREKYHSLFLSNYMGGEQKILSRHYAERLLNYAIQEQTQ